MLDSQWVFSCLVALINSWHADKTQEKFWHSVWPIGMGIVGFVISIATMNTAARYLALFLQGQCERFIACSTYHP